MPHISSKMTPDSRGKTREIAFFGSQISLVLGEARAGWQHMCPAADCDSQAKPKPSPSWPARKASTKANLEWCTLRTPHNTHCRHFRLGLTCHSSVACLTVLAPPHPSSRPLSVKLYNVLSILYTQHATMDPRQERKHERRSRTRDYDCRDVVLRSRWWCNSN